jgi:hypothetical protein
MNSDVETWKADLGPLPEQMQWEQYKGYWVVKIASPKADVLRAFGGFVIVGFGIIIGVMPQVLDLWRASSSRALTMGYGILVLLLAFFSFTSILLFWSGLQVYGQRLRLVLGREKVLFIQYTSFLVRQRYQVYHLAKIENVALQPIAPALVNVHVHGQHQALHLTAALLPVDTLGWGYYLGKEQLAYTAALLNHLYVENHAPALIPPETTKLDLSDHLLE